MLLFELSGILSVLLYVGILARVRPEGARFLRFMLGVAAVGWMVEESSILLYGFYGYSPKWHFFIDRVPLLVVMVWPAIIHCARDLASQMLGPEKRLVPLAAGAIVLTDAALIEPVSVFSGLWAWHVPGIFDVPLIGIFGWGVFAFLCILVFEGGKGRSQSLRMDLSRWATPFVGTHLMLLVSWWGVFRWINRPLDPGLAAGCAWAVALCLAFVFLKYRTAAGVETRILVLRLPAALFFFILLVFNAGDCTALIFYGAAFALPYLTLMVHPMMSMPRIRKGLF